MGVWIKVYLLERQVSQKGKDRRTVGGGDCQGRLDKGNT